MTDPVLRDLTRHLSDRIDRCVSDTADRLLWAGVKFPSKSEAINHLTAVLLTKAAAIYKLSDSHTLDDFVKSAAHLYSATEPSR